MAGFTAAISAGVALAGVAASTGQAIKGAQDKKKASRAGVIAANQARSVTEANKMAAVQSPDIMKRAEQSIAQQQAQALQAANSTGARGAAQVPGMVQAGNESALNAAQAQAQQDLNVDTTIASTDRDIEQRRAKREYDTAMATVAGAGQAEVDAELSIQQGVLGVVGSAGTLATGLMSDAPLYKKDNYNEAVSSLGFGGTEEQYNALFNPDGSLKPNYLELLGGSNEGGI